MKITRIVLFVLLAVAVNALFAWLCNLPQDAGPDVPQGKISSFSFAPFREGHSPLTETFPAKEEVEEDLRMLADKTHTIRTYASLGGGGLMEVPALARKYGLKMIQGAWLGYVDPKNQNQAEVQQLIKAANEYPDVIERVIVGNEVLLRGELKPEQLIQYIRQVKQAVKQPVSYADVWSFYMQYPEIAKEVDFITVHILPYWEDEPLSIEKAATHIEEHVRQIQTAFPGKPILIGESGWPSAGRQRGWAVPSVVNEAKFIRSLVQVANENGFEYNIVEAFNQPWKSKLEGVVGANWGLYSVGREAVFPLTGKVVENPHWPQRVIYAALLLLMVVAFYAKRSAQLSPLRLAGFVGFTQLLAALLVNQAGDLWYISYSDLQRGQTLFIVALSAAFGALALRRALDMLGGQNGPAIVGICLRYLFLGFVALAIYKALGLALNGRYLSIPYPLTGIAVVGVLGLTVIRYFSAEQNLSQALEFSALLGDASVSPERNRMIATILGFAGAILIIVETAVIMSGPEYVASYPALGDRIWPAFISTLTQSLMLGWAMLIATVVFLLPPRISSYALGFMVLAVMVGETYAFTAGHDFIDAHPQMGDRIWTAFVYTIGNCQMQLWLVSLAVLAVPLLCRGQQFR